MAANSKTSTRKDNDNTTPEQALEILQQSLEKCKAKGWKVGVDTLYNHGEGGPKLIIVIQGAKFVQGDFVPVGGNDHTPNKV